MENEKIIKAWKIFLKGRINQEKGSDEEALKSIEKALKIYPDNPHFLNAKANALNNLKNHQEALIAKIDAGYKKLAQSLVGDNDQPRPWINGLEKIHKMINDFEEDVKSIMIHINW